MSAEVLDRIQRECLRAYPQEMLAEMASYSEGEIPADVDASPDQQRKFLDTTLEGDKGPFYPFMLEELYPALAAFVRPGASFLDLGSGDGRVVFLASVLGADAYGIEYEDELVEISNRAREALGDLVDESRVHFIRGDFFESSWSDYDVIYYYDPSSFESERVREKMARELDPKARLLVGLQRTPFPGLALETSFEKVHVYRQPVEGPDDGSLVRSCTLEIVDFHQFLEDWYNGAVENSDARFARFAGVTAQGFRWISVDGRTIVRQTLADELRQAYGRWRGSDGDPGRGRIWVHDIRPRLVEGPIALMAYEEWQRVDGAWQGSQISAVFRPARGPRFNGVEWQYVHATRLPPAPDGPAFLHRENPFRSH